MTNLKSVNIGMNKYCGPAVLSILTGKSTDECASVISSINGKYKIEGVELKHLLLAAERLGFDAESVAPAHSLFGTLTRLADKDGLYIVTIKGHFVAVEVNGKNIYFCDNHTKEPINAAASARLTQSVVAVHKVFKRREPLQISSRIEVVKSNSLGHHVTIEIHRQYRYDMPQHDKKVFIAALTFDTQQDFDEFVSQITKEI